MNKQNSGPRATTSLLRCFRTAMLLLFFFAAFLFFGGLSWGAYSIPLLALIGVGIALLPGILFIVFGIVVGIMLGWLMALASFCKRRVGFTR